jgi:hypothetical protein
MFSSRKFDNCWYLPNNFSSAFSTVSLVNFSLFEYRLNYRMTSVVYWQFYGILNSIEAGVL